MEIRTEATPLRARRRRTGSRPRRPAGSAAHREPPAAGRPTPPPRPSGAEVYVDPQLGDYVAALINATDPRRTDGILSGAPQGAAASVLGAARLRARAAGRRHVIPADVRGAALEVLSERIIMIDPEVDPRGIIRAILDVVDAP